MATLEYSLFRAKFIKPVQSNFFVSDTTPSQLFLASIQEKPSAELREGYFWHIGNIRFFDSYTGYFAIGRTTKSTMEKFDNESGDFIEEEVDTSPYTHCVFDAAIGILGIARKTSLAPTVKGIANRVQQLLSTADAVQNSSVTVEIAPIPDPEGFLRSIQSAYRVWRFAATFHGTNPFDADEFFQKPLSVYLTAANGSKGKAQIQGDDLNRDVLESVTRSTAATGNEASASIMRQRSRKSVTVHLKGDPVKLSYDEGDHRPEDVLNDLEKEYQRVRAADETDQNRFR